MHSRKRPRAARKPRILHVFTDFDNTMVRENTAKLLVKYYLTRNPHHEPLHRRIVRAGSLLSGYLHGRYIANYYDCLRRIPALERHRILAAVHPHPRWLRVIKELRLRHRARAVRLTIVTRNALDVVHGWVMQNRDELRRHHVSVESIVAHGPLNDADILLVRERAGLRHIDYLAFGQLLSEEKKAFLGCDAIYVGDADDALLAPLVKEFVRI